MSEKDKKLEERLAKRFPSVPPLPAVNAFSDDFVPTFVQTKNTVRQLKMSIHRKCAKQNFDKVKNQVLENEMEPFDSDNVESHQAREDIIRQVETLPHYSLPDSIKIRIVMMLGSKVKQYPSYEQNIDELMREVSEEMFSSTMHNVVVDRTLKRFGSYESDTMLPFECMEQSSNRKKFLKLREDVEENLKVTYHFLRDLLQQVLTFLPEIGLDTVNLRTRDGYKFTELSNILDARAAAVCRNVRETWWWSTLTIMKKHRAWMDDTVWCRYNRAALLLLHSFTTIMILHTVDTFVEIIGNEESTPFFKMTIIMDPQTKYKLDPDFEELKCYYCGFIDDLMNLTKKLPERSQFARKNDDENSCADLDIALTFERIMKQKLTTNLQRIYLPIFEHVVKLVEEYGPLYDEDKLEELVVENDLSFEDSYKLIKMYQDLLKKVTYLQPHVRFKAGILDQTKLITSFKRIGKNFIDGIITRTIELVCINVEDILEMYEFLRMRAESVPHSTGELLELTQYMMWASSNHVQYLYDRTASAVKDTIQLLNIAFVPSSCFEKLIRAIKWIYRIPAILEENTSMLERVKFDLEENLQRNVENLQTEIHNITPKLEIFDNMDDANRAREYMKDMRRIIKQIQRLEELQLWINNEEILFKFPVSSYSELEEVKMHIFPFYRLIYVCLKWNRCYNVWMDGPFESLQHDEVESTVDDIYKELEMSAKAFRNKIKQMITENNPRRFSGIVDDPDPLNLPAPLKLCVTSMQQIKDFRPNIALISVFCSSALAKRHWDEMSEIAGFDLTPNAGTTLRKLINKDLRKQLEKYEVISTSAIKERQLYINLTKMMTEWEDIHFKISTYKDTGIRILSDIDDIKAVLEDHIIKTLTLRGSVFVKYYEGKVKAWYNKITRMSNTMDHLDKVQSQWLYLLPIFSSKDIVFQMPYEGELLERVGNTYQQYMSAVEKNDQVLSTAGEIGMLEAMLECTELLDKINEGVANYLEKKRLYFPRFFFLSNHEMFEILSETKDPLRVQPHLRKCFEGINKLEFNDELEILAMYSQEGEKVDMINKINTEEVHGSVEKWLVQVEKQMVISVKNQMLFNFENYVNNLRTTWVQICPGQVVLALSLIYWTANVHRCLDINEKGNLVDFHDELTNELQDIVSLMRSPEISNLNRITIKALIVLDVHAKDVVKNLLVNGVQFDNEFKWVAQLRYYWCDNCLVRMFDATISYAYEYLGNLDRLVITPLTDRSYRTLISAYQLHLNSAPEGPAGTGKTETIKDLAKAIAVQCVVFNCSEDLDYKTMSKFFKGLASSGAWACFDEFNRIEIEVLSVVAQLVLNIVLAVRAKLTKFVFEGITLDLNPSVYICITMKSGLEGRSELPDNLKVLFRAVAMTVPDFTTISAISLFSYGFKYARILAAKIVAMYRLCSEQLSSQNHYDYGMRAIKSVLVACGTRKRNFPNENEDTLLLRCLIDLIMPQFVPHDVPLFQGIIRDLFPDIIVSKPDYTNIICACELACENRNLQPKEIFVEKVIQTYEMMLVRHGFMLIGDPFSGKTSTLLILADALRIMHDRGLNQVAVNYQFINPKSVTLGQLYGQFDPVSHEWRNGIVTTCYRRFAMDTSGDRSWIIFDGPIDDTWIESMNTVLDDNKKLCLLSGESIHMTNKMSMIFETTDLAQASPETVSRCGIIYMESKNLGWRPFFESWLHTVSSEWAGDNKKSITTLFDWIIPACLQYIRKHCVQYVYPGDVNMVLSTMQITEIILDDACVEFEDDAKNSLAWVQASLMLAVTWGIAGILDADSRLKFDEFYKELWKGNHESYPIPKTEKVEIQIPAEGTLMDYTYVFKSSKGIWKYWPDIVRQQKISDIGNLQQIVIPTVDTERYMHMISMLIKHNKPVMLVGPTGTGKTFYMQNLLTNGLDQNTYESSFINFTAQTRANQTQEHVISKLVKGKHGNFDSPAGKKTIIFIDDINMPLKEKYGDQPSIELLRQFFDHKHWYNLRGTSKIFLHNVLFVAAMGLTGGSRQELYPRFLRHFTIFSINDFGDETVVKIFINVLFIAFKRNGFAADIMANVQCITNATLDLFKGCNANLLPTPTKSHYIFKLHDFSRVIQGCGMLKKDSAENKKIFAKLWVHESLRVFYDRLIDEQDKNWLFERLQECVEEYFKDNFESVFCSLRNEENQVTQLELRNLMFGTYLDLAAPEEERKYEEIESVDVLKEIALNYLEEYNSTHKTKMDIVLFKFAVEHLSKLCRILSMPRGNALLVGISGSGRQSLARLATAICGHKFFQPKITKNYGLVEFRNEIKVAFKFSGGLGRHTVFLFSEDQLKEDSFLQDLDSFLNSGEIPNLYGIEEKEEVLELVRLTAQGGNRNLDISPLAVFSFFVNRCREKLHIVFSFSPIETPFRRRLRLYPSLVDCCTIDWYEAWSEDTLEAVAHNWIKDLSVPVDTQAAAVKACKYIHVCAETISNEFYLLHMQRSYVTFASYLNLVISYQVLINRKQKEILQAKHRYLSGLEKLDFAADQVSLMQESLKQLQPQLKAMTERATAMLVEIERETKEAEHASMLVREDEKVAKIQAARATTLKAECEAELAQAIPILEEAIEALNTLKPSDITLVKSMKNPPAAIKLVMAAVCVIKDIKPDRVPNPATGRMQLDYWGPSKRLLGEMNFLQQLKDFDKDNISIATMIRIRKEFLPHKDFRPEVVAKASSAAEGLCKWIIAMDLYDAVAREVAPKKIKLEMAEAEYNSTMDILQEKRNQVQRLEERVNYLKEQLSKAEKEQVRLSAEVQRCTEKLVRAKQLIFSLSGEKNRWMKSADDLQKQYDNLPGNILLSCGLIAYLAPYTMLVRMKAITDWLDFCKRHYVPCSDEFDLSQVLGSDVEIQSWYINGLPRDNFSTQNAIIQHMSQRWSLLIDPQLQANNWIKEQEKQNSLSVVKLSDANYMQIIEHCVEFGTPVLIENILETLDVTIDPLLQKKTFKKDDKLVIILGNKMLHYNDNFRMYLTSKLRNPQYLPEAFNKVTIVNFSLTTEGLENQLLNITVINEKTELQQEREELVIESAENKVALEKVEDTILKILSESKDNILEDEEGIKDLEYSKEQAADILSRQTIIKDTQKKIDKHREIYRSVAEYSATLYYTICDLQRVDPMYQYSLKWFLTLYRTSVVNSRTSQVFEEHMKNIENLFTYNLYSNICRSLFEKDKLLYSFLLCTRIMIYRKELREDEYRFFVTGGISIQNSEKNPAPEWLAQNQWDEICRLSKLLGFTGFLDHLKHNLKMWCKYNENSKPESINLPEPWDSQLTLFEKLLMLKILRPDQLLEKVTQYISYTLGPEYVQPPLFDIWESYCDSNKLRPLVFILSPGTDPMLPMTKLTERMSFTEKFVSVSLGQGQGPIAEEIILKASVEGKWVYLQNCHLALSWMPHLEEIYESMDFENIHDSFRLWLSSYPFDKFPVSLLADAVKMTNEPPTELHKNLLHLFLSDPIADSGFLFSVPTKETSFGKLVYALYFFHAVVQERRTFGSLGWNIPYDYNDSDLHVSIQQLQMFMNNYEDVPYEVLLYLIGECNYGGRITDEWDRRLVNTILQDFINPHIIYDNQYCFSDISPFYGLPNVSTADTFIQHIQKLPTSHSPEVLGLNNNAGITLSLQKASVMHTSLLSLQCEASSVKEDTESLLLSLCGEIIAKLPAPFDMEAAKQKYPIDYDECMNTVLVHELDGINRLLDKIRSSLMMLDRAVQGRAMMTPDLDILANSLLLSRIPVVWAQVSYPSLKCVSAYVSDFLKRIQFLQEWYDTDKPPTFWLSGFFFPNAFLAGVKQNHARNLKIPIEQLDFDHEVMPENCIAFSVDQGVFVNGLFVDGARWDRSKACLEEQLPNILSDVLPAVWLKPILTEEFRASDRYKSPVYKTSERRGTLSTAGYSTNYIFPIYLNTKRDPAHWIKRSVALLCQSD